MSFGYGHDIYSHEYNYDVVKHRMTPCRRPACTALPHSQVFGVHALIPHFCATESRISSYYWRSPTDDIGATCNQSPEFWTQAHLVEID